MLKWDQMAHKRNENQHSNFDRIKKQKASKKTLHNQEDDENWMLTCAKQHNFDHN